MPFPPPPPALIIAQTEQLAVVRITIEDGLRIGEFLSPASEPLTIFVQAPAKLLVQGELSEAHKEQLLAHMYGPSWRDGNEDGSQYVVLTYSSTLLSQGDAGAGSWKTTPGAWVYQISDQGLIEKLGEGYVPK